jgi:ABC-2 type transport system ATP-binding protein
MTQLTLESAWVEFPVSLGRRSLLGRAQVGGQIDAKRGVITALSDISLELREGDRLGLMGHNGAGKTTMLRLLAGAYPPTRGRLISVGRISTLFNTTPGLNMDGTGRENLIACGLHLGLSWRQINAKVDEIVDFAELGDYIDLPVRIYSTGMITRLGFSIATSVEPEILLLDEGLATGDAQFAQKAERKMNDLIERSSILVIASHSETMLANMCSRCLLLEHGRIVSDGPAKTLFESYRNSVIESARRDESDALLRAYTLATDMVRRGERPPIELEEQGLRHALRNYPNDIMMLQRYVDVLRIQGKEIPPETEERLLLAIRAKDLKRADPKGTYDARHQEQQITP